MDPYLDAIRDDSRFGDIVSEIESLNAAMRERVAEAEASGDWAQLLALASSS